MVWLVVYGEKSNTADNYVVSRMMGSSTHTQDRRLNDHQQARAIVLFFQRTFEKILTQEKNP